MTTERHLVAGGSAFEDLFGYSRAVRHGDLIAVAGCTAMTPEGPVGGDDPAAQTREAIQRIQRVLRDLGAELENVIRTRVFVLDIATWREVGAVHTEYFGQIRPASTIVEVRALIDPRLLVEIEADAVLPVPSVGRA